MARQIVIFLVVITMGSVLGASVYNSVVDPGTFFRVASPLAQVLALLALIVCWRVPGARAYAGTALAATIVADVMTFAYFYPRNAIIMGDLRDVEAAARAWREWARMNHVRNAVMPSSPN